MAKNIYIGESSVARKVKKAYIGINGVARKIKKMYIGVAGIARLFFSSAAEVNIVESAIEDMRYAKYTFASTATDSHAIFAGGGYSSGEAYNEELVRSNVELSLIANHHGAATINNNAIFHGDTTAFDVVDTSLTRTTITSGYGWSANTLIGGENKKYAVFGTGASSGTFVTCLNESLTFSYTSLSTSAGNYSNTISTSDYIAFNLLNGSMDVFDTSLTMTTVEGIQSAQGCAGGNIDGCLAIAGGISSGVIVNTINIFDTSLTKVATTNMSSVRYFPIATSLGNYLLVGGGTDGASAIDTVDIFDNSFTLVKTLNMSVARYAPCAETIGNYALFAGGSSLSSNWNNGKEISVDAFVLDE